MSAFLTLITCLPELLKLIKSLQTAADQAEEDRKVKEDLKKIHEAFNEKDASKLNDLFSNR
jgi:hypothetical protein